MSREWGAVSRGKARDGMPGWGARGVVFIVARGPWTVARGPWTVARGPWTVFREAESDARH